MTRSKTLRALFGLFVLCLIATSTPVQGMQILWGEPPVDVPFEVRLVGTTFVVPLDFVRVFGGSVVEFGGGYRVTVGEKTVNFRLGQAVAESGGHDITLPQPVQQFEGAVWVPLRTLADHLLDARLSVSSGRLHLKPWHPLPIASLRSVNVPLTVDEKVDAPVRSVEPARRDEQSVDTESVPADVHEGAEPADGLGSTEDLFVPHTEPAAPRPFDSVGDREPGDTERRSEEAVLQQELPSTMADAQQPDVATESGLLVPAESLPAEKSHESAEPPVTVPETEKGVVEVALYQSVVRFGGFVSLDRREPPRLEVRLPYVPPLAGGPELPAVKQTILRAERLDWVEARVTRGDHGKDVVLIEGSKAFHHNSFLLTNPARLVIDLIGLDTGHALEPLYINGPNIQRIRLNQNTPDTVRIVLDLTDPIGYAVVSDPSGQALRIELHHAVRRVTGRFSAVSGTVRLDIPRDTQYEVLRLTDPDRLVVDLFDTTLVPGAEFELSPEGPIREWRIQQFDPSRTRLVLTVERHLDIVADPFEDSLTFHVGHQVRRIGYAVLPGAGLVVHIDGAKLPDPHIMYLAEPDRLVIDLPGTVLSQPLVDTILQDEWVAWRIRSAQHPEMVRIVLDLNSSVEYDVFRLADGRGLAVAALVPSLHGRKVFLDPGHGGHDPGTIGRVMGVLEKDVVLDIAVRLRRLLEQAGADVVLSRHDDRFVALDQRPAMAHAAGADLFLSIHANASSWNSEAGGTETYIYNRPSHPDNPRLAAAVQRHLVSTIGLQNRGVRSANFAVLRNARIPAALVEVAFLSRAEEERLLSEGWFRERVAQGLFNGIVAFFSEGISRAASRPSAERERLEQGIENELANDAFAYLLPRDESESTPVGIVTVQPL